MFYSAGPCSVCGVLGDALFVKNPQSGQVFFFCPSCGVAWGRPPAASNTPPPAGRRHARPPPASRLGILVESSFNSKGRPLIRARGLDWTPKEVSRNGGTVPPWAGHPPASGIGRTSRQVFRE